MKRKLLYSVLLLALSCYNPKEFSTMTDSGVIKLRVADNTIVGAVEGIPDGRTICSIGSTEFLVTAGTGEVFRINSVEMTVETSFSVGFAGGAGYRSMIYPIAGSVYLTGAAGNLLEIDLNENKVADDFEAGPSPSVLCPNPSSQETFFLADGSDRRVREINTATNTVLRTTQAMSGSPSALAAETYLNQYLLAAFQNEAGSVAMISLATFHVSTVSLGYPCMDVAAFPAESIWAVTHPEWQAENGMVTVCRNFIPPEVDRFQLDGHPMKICSVPGTTKFYVLSYLGGGDSRLVSLNYLTGEVESLVDVQGFPWDIIAHANGEYVLALTSGL